MSNTIYIIGSGGHARVVARAVEENHQNPIMIVSDSKGEAVGMDSITEAEFMANPPIGDKWGVICGVGSVGSMFDRDQVLKRYERFSGRFVCVISPRAMVDSSAVLEPGVFVGPGAIIANNVRIGQNCLINTGAIIEHDCVIDENCHVASGATVLGGVRLGQNVFVGAGTVIIQGVLVADGVVVGASSFCSRSIKNANETWIGAPARRLSK